MSLVIFLSSTFSDVNLLDQLIDTCLLPNPIQAGGGGGWGAVCLPYRFVPFCTKRLVLG